MHAFDRQTDGQTDGRTDGQTDRNLIVKTALHSMQRGKNYSDSRMQHTALFKLSIAVRLSTPEADGIPKDMPNTCRHT